MMFHQFDIAVAQKHGTNAAILLHNIILWIRHNKSNRKNFHDGRTWTYNSVKAWAEQFPYMTKKQVRTALDVLRDAGVILTGNYNEKANDKTLWYALADEGKWLAPQGKEIAPEGKSYIGTDNLPCDNTGNVSTVSSNADTTNETPRPDIEKEKNTNVVRGGELDLQSRQAEFREHVYLTGGLTYTSDMLDRFISTFSQPNGSKRPKMRWEIERTRKGWDTAERLKLWATRNIDRIQCFLREEDVQGIHEKRRKFAKEIEVFRDRYDRDMLNEFYRHWGLPEAGNNPKRLRWELEEFWDLGTKLASWFAREQKRARSFK